MSKKSLLVLALVLVAACSEPSLGPASGSSGGDTRQVPPREVPPRQPCQQPGDAGSPSHPLSRQATAQEQQCQPIQ